MTNRTNVDALQSIKDYPLEDMNESLLTIELTARVHEHSPAQLPLLREAIKMAADLHKKDKRKTLDGQTTPYILHPLRVALNLARLGCEDVETLVAAILHDTVEDHAKEIARDYAGKADVTDLHEQEKIAFAYMEEMFGVIITEVIRQVTNPIAIPGSSKESKREAYVEHARGIKGWRAILVKISDLADNAFKLVPATSIEREGMVKHLAAKYSPLPAIFLTHFHNPALLFGLPQKSVNAIIADLEKAKIKLLKLV